jgi:hypothetical protein
MDDGKAIDGDNIFDVDMTEGGTRFGCHGDELYCVDDK